MTQERKIIQISAHNKIVALCDDGTTWELVWFGRTNNWEQLPPIPQPEPEPKP
jgi:hypothetical protein